MLQGNNPPPGKGLDYVGGSQSGSPECPNTLYMPPHLFSHGGGPIPGLVSYRHPIISLDDILLLKINIIPFICKAFLGGLNWEDNVLSLCPKGEVD